MLSVCLILTKCEMIKHTKKKQQQQQLSLRSYEGSYLENE